MEWWTRCRPNYDAHPMAKYTIMIRGPDDPERMPREAHPNGRQPDMAPHRTIAKMDILRLKRIILNHLSDGEPRTFNRIGVELWDKTADLLGGTKIETALWDLCVEGSVAFTDHAPILFRWIEPSGQLNLF